MWPGGEKFSIEEEYFCGQEVRSFRLKRNTFVSGFVRVRRKRTRCSYIAACTGCASADEYHSEIASLVFVNWKVAGVKEGEKSSVLLVVEINRLCQ